MSQIAYFNNAATTYPKPEKVYTFADKFYRETGVNSGRGQINSASKLTTLTRQMLLELFHAKNKKVVFTPSATEAINVILRGLPLTDNCTVYVSPFEHNAVIRTLHYLQGIYKLNIITLAVDETTLKYDVEKIKYQFSESTPNLVVMSHGSNVCGVVAPIQKICTLSHGYGAINVIDMCQTAGLIDTDISGSIYDFVVFAGHKTLYATFGIAGFICNGDIILEPLIFGGTGIDSANLDVPDTIPERYEVGSQNILGIAGLYAALEWNKEIGISNIYAKEQASHDKLLNILKKYDNIKVIMPADDVLAVGVVSCVFDGYSSDNIGQILSEQGVEVRTGLHCAPTAHKFLGTFPAGTVRFSVSYFNTDEDFEKLDEALEYIHENS
ncbi:aminotransferase class V-fold PLP-dependent enzyme [Anaerotignum propionicum]|uniref:aminotransferase class V-fold PLP-dependent enzyme n=1 Tax=Anaerotignum propionicum TaxID=28446 RepID=UPI00210BE691|nr:aminotransferase class V-fold PLP-dependent enzyme [Anaerotignum propionicum]MCQ4936360.1 aminotransferase class V-fold PLP-dependent enzyme [Anaerotignum propionicum]